MVEKIRVGRGFTPHSSGEKTIVFKMVRTATTSLIFMILFWFVTPQITQLWGQLLFIIMSVITSMVLGSVSARLFTRSSYRDDKDFQYFVRFIMIVTFYGVLVWVINYIGAFETMKFGFTLMFFIVAKSFVFLLADFLADKMAFGG